VYDGRAESIAHEIAEAPRKAGWSVVWKAEGGSTFIDFLLTFGIAKTPEEMLARIQHTLLHGRSRPPQTAGEFRKMVEGGVFYLYGAHLCIPVPRGVFTEEAAIKRLHRHALIL
jgi:hypothetical protein